MLDVEDVQKLRLTLASSGWNDVIQKALKKRILQATNALCLEEAERLEHFKGTDFATDDKSLRAIIRDSIWMTTVWYNEVNVAEHNRQLDELERRQAAGTANP